MEEIQKERAKKALSELKGKLKGRDYILLLKVRNYITFLEEEYIKYQEYID